MKNQHFKFLSNLLKYFIFPAFFYLIIFLILTYPLILKFHTHYFADSWDGLQGVWHVWWVNKAVTELHQSPWFTNYLYYPYGTSLLGETLTPFNGFIGIILLKYLSLIQTFNVIVIFSFFMAGVTCFWLAYYITKSYWSSIIAGYIFTFSQYHFMHAEGHLQLVSLQWIPLFVLCWYVLITKPGILIAIVSAIVLFNVYLCDHYYFLYCVLTGILMILWYAISIKDFLFFLKKQYLLTFITFTFITLITSGILVGSLLWLNIIDPMSGAHEPLEFSLDALAPFIPGGHWRFSHLTEFYWSRLPGNINESSVYIGWSVVILMFYTWRKRKESNGAFSSLSLWYLILLFFSLLALGPALQIGGKIIYSGIMPYTVLEKLLPPLKLSGVPVRMMVMVMLSASVISAIGLSVFKRLKSKSILAAGIWGVFLFFEFLPKPIPSSNPVVPEYINLLKRLPENGAVIDMVNPIPHALYYQVIHEKPMMDGYISRYNVSVLAELKKKLQAVKDQDYFTLIEKYNVRYIISPSGKIDAKSHNAKLLKLLYAGKDVSLFQIQETKSLGEKNNLKKYSLSNDYFKSFQIRGTKLPVVENNMKMFSPSDDYLGYIDMYNGKEIKGWALIRNKNTTSSQIFIFLSDGKRSWMFSPSREKRRDVSDYYKKGNLYDDSGYELQLYLYDIPRGTYKIGIGVINKDRKVIKWSNYVFVSS